MLSPQLFVVHGMQPVFRRGNAGSERFRNEENDRCPVVRKHSLDCKMQVSSKNHLRQQNMPEYEDRGLQTCVHNSHFPQ